MKKNVPLYKQIEDHFIELIKMGKLQPNDRIPSESEIIDTFHVSQITAKNALNNLAEQGYVKRIQGKGTFVDGSTVRNKERVIGIIFTTINTYIDKELLDYLEYYCRKMKIRFYFGLSRESLDKEVQLIDHFIKAGVEGLIVFPTESEKYNESLLKIQLDSFPLVLIDRYFDKLDITSVSSDNFSGGYKLADMLIKKGLTQLSFITTIEENSATIDRQKGIEAAFVAHNIPINKNLWLEVPSETSNSSEITVFLEQSNPQSVITINAHISDLISSFTTENNIFHLSFDNPDGCDYYIKQNTKLIAKRTILKINEALEQKNTTSEIVLIPVKVAEGHKVRTENELN